MIRFEHVCKQFDHQSEALRDITFTIEKGDLVFLTGHSGAGKSTLLKLISALERPTRGKVIVNQHDISKIRARKIPYLRRDIGVIFQDHRLLLDKTVFDNVALPLKISGYSHLDIRKRVQAALDKVGLLRKQAVYPMNLSGGEQQRVGIARAIVNKPLILLADEPTGNLDAELAQEVMSLFIDFNRVGVTVLIATHNLSLIGRSASSVLTLEQGRLLVDNEEEAVA